MSKLKREIGYLGRGMDGIRMTFAKLQQDPSQTPVSRVGSRWKKIISKQGYTDEWQQSRNQES